MGILVEIFNEGCCALVKGKPGSHEFVVCNLRYSSAYERMGLHKLERWANRRADRQAERHMQTDTHVSWQAGRWVDR
jgi:hypothetical protein